MSKAGTPALKQETNPILLENGGPKFSLVAWGPKRPPLLQESPLEAGTSKVAAPSGRCSLLGATPVTSTMKVRWRIACWQNAPPASEVTTTKSRTLPPAGALAAQSGRGTPRTG